MKLQTLKLFAFASLILVLTACGGHHKPDQDKDLAPSDVSADWSKAQQVDDNTVIADKSLGEPKYEGADAKNAAKVTEKKSEDFPLADENTQTVQDDLKLDNENPTPTPKVAAAKTKTEKKTTKKVVAAGVPAEKAIQWLEHGNARFVKHHLRNDGQSAADRARLVKAQHPHSVIFACSDSRVPPEIIFDQKLGEIYVVRTDALAIDTAVINSLEKAVDDYGTQLLVVLSNSGCGVAANKVADQLITKSAPLAEKVNMGGLKIVPATYDLQSGLVRFE